MEISQNFERQRITSGYILNPKHCAELLSYGFDSIAFTRCGGCRANQREYNGRI
jgi:hypothetical protein